MLQIETIGRAHLEPASSASSSVVYVGACEARVYYPAANLLHRLELLRLDGA